MTSKNLFQAEASRIVRAELVRRQITYKNLSKLLESDGIYENELQLKSKINKGRFSFFFFIQVARAIGAKNICLAKLDAFSNPRPTSDFSDITISERL
jgi:hypothetical protein